MASNVRIVSRFPAATAAAHEVVRLARDQALLAGENEANDRISRNDMALGYDLPADVTKETIGFQSGKIVYEHFYGHFFENGTVHIPAIPFMRPASRKMRTVFKAVMGSQFEPWITRRASVR